MIRPSSGLFGRVHWRGDASDGARRYALTFDDGPTDPSTSAILDTLGELGARATFFVVGLNVRRHPRLVERMHAEGHLVANHSFTHPHFGMMRGPWYWRRQIAQTDAAIGQIIGRRPAMFRPPMGVKSWFICGAARRLGHEVVTWSRRGFDGVSNDPRAILERLVTRTSCGDVLLLHDGVEPNVRRDPSVSVAVVRPLICQLRNRGLEPAPLDELLHLPAYARPIASARHGSPAIAAARG
jgi:peptidoglycan/xylan/chitin deacetylase (PgdA/CDA1 family)